MKRLFGTVLATALLLLSSLALAQGSEADKATARQLSFEAQKALTAKDYAKAADLFGRAEKLYHAPTLLVGLARASVGLGKFVEAREAYNRVIREADASTPTFKRALDDAKKEVVGLDDEIGWLTINVTGAADPTVTIDDEEVAAASLGVKRAVNPGSHRVKASAEGNLPGEQTVEVAAGASEEVTLELRLDPNAVTVDQDAGPDTPAPGADHTNDGGSTLTTVGFVALGVGAAGLIVGAVTGGLAIGKHGELKDNCDPQGQCPADQQSTLDSFHTLGTVSTVGFIAGGVLAAAGVTLVVIGMTGGGEGDGVDSAEIELGPGHLGARLRF